MWVASTAIFLSTTLSYMDRNILAVLSVTILAQTGITGQQYATAIACFSFAYAIGNPLWGSFIDYVGLRVGLLVAVTVWTLASTSHAWVAGFVGFAVARAVLGFGEGAVFPGALRTATDSLPPNRQGRGMALGYSGASMGTILTPILVIPFALHYSWRAAFLVTGGLGACWLVLWSMIARPPFLPAATQVKRKIIWPNLAERRFWLIVSSFGMGAVALGVVGYLAPLYLNRVFGIAQKDLRWLLVIPNLGWEVGYFFWGWIADRYMAEMPDRNKPARIFILLTVLALPAALMTYVHTLPAVLALMFWSVFVADGFVVMSLRVGTRIYPSDRTAMVGGVGSSSWAAVQALVFLVYGRWFDQKLYTALFVSMALLPIVGTAIWLKLSRQESLWYRQEPSANN